VELRVLMCLAMRRVTSKTNQTITFGPFADRAVGESFAVAATQLGIASEFSILSDRQPSPPAP